MAGKTDLNYKLFHIICHFFNFILVPIKTGLYTDLYKFYITITPIAPIIKEL